MDGGEFEDFDNLADMRLATLERQVKHMAEQILVNEERVLHNNEKIKLMCGVIMGIYEEDEKAS